LSLSAISCQLSARSFVLLASRQTCCHSEPALSAGEESVVVSIAGEFGDDGIFPLLYPGLSYMARAMTGFEPATFGL